MSNEWDDELASATPVERIMARAKFRATTDEAFLALMEDMSISGRRLVAEAVNRVTADAVKAYRNEVVSAMLAIAGSYDVAGPEAHGWVSHFAKLAKSSMDDIADAVAKAVGA